MNLDPRHLLLVAALAVAPLAACSSDDGDDAAPETTAAEATETTEAASDAEPLQILVSNDDGVDAEGIDALVEGLLTLDDVELTIVAPLEQQSGTGGSETDGDLTASEATTASGEEATAVDGFPADAIRYAFDELEVEPDLVITGINEGQNLGPVIDASGTVGGARKAVSYGVPALASSQGFGEPEDYPSAVELILDWVADHRDELLAGDAEVEVTSLNVPSCGSGELQELVEVEPETDAEGGDALRADIDCVGLEEPPATIGDVTAFNAGHPTIAVLPAEPAGP